LPAWFRIDARSGVPLYLQLTEQVKRAIATGALASGERLPTVKALALDLALNPNTIAKVYRDLEREGLIETSPGRGSFVARTEAGGRARNEAAEELARRGLSDAVREARALGIESTDLSDFFHEALKQWYRT
jgi:GntR family transcriptional regulator